MSINPIEQIKAQLDRKYDLITNNHYEVSDKTFFVGIADYVAVASNIPMVNKIIMDTIVLEQRKEQEKVNAIERQAVAELEQFAKELIKYLEKKKIYNDSDIQNSIKEYEQLFSKGYHTSQSAPVARFGNIREIAEVISSKEGRYKKYIEKFLVPVGDGLNTKWNFGTSYYEYRDQQEKFEQEIKIAIWGSWNDLTLAFNAFFRSSEIRAEYTDMDKFFEYLDWSYLFDERDTIIEEKEKPHHGSFTQFKRNSYKHSLWRVHNHLVDQLSSRLSLQKDKDNDVQNTFPTPDEVITVKGLFEIADNPPKIHYIGQAENDKEWLPLKGKTQTFAILYLVAEKYRRNSAIDKTSPFVKINYVDIVARLNDKNFCSNTPKWTSIPTSSRQLGIMRKNIRSIIPFTDKELSIEKTDETAHLVFTIPKS